MSYVGWLHRFARGLGAVDQCWNSTLGSYTPKCTALHMLDAAGRRGEFSWRNGWSERKVDQLLRELVRQCLAPCAWEGPDGPSLFKISCIINDSEWRSACSSAPGLKNHGRHGICARVVTECALRRLPQKPGKPNGQRVGEVELVFDRGEPFKRQIEDAWRKATDRSRGQRGPLSLISDILEADWRTTPGLQAADFLAWSLNRLQTRGCQQSWWRTFVSCPGVNLKISSDVLVRWFHADLEGRRLQIGPSPI